MGGSFEIVLPEFIGLEFSICTPPVWDDEYNQYSQDYYGGPEFKLYSDIPITLPMKLGGSFNLYNNWEEGILKVSVDWDTKEITLSSPTQPQKYNFLIDNLYYTIIDSNSVSVSTYAWEELSGNYDLTIPEKVEYNGKVYNVTRIEPNAFAGCAMESVIIPNSVIEIGEEAFSGCKSLIDVKLPSNISEIRNYTFTQCFALKYIKIPPKVTKIT